LYIVGSKATNRLARNADTSVGINIELATPDFRKARNYAIDRANYRHYGYLVLNNSEYCASGDITVQGLKRGPTIIVKALEIGGVQEDLNVLAQPIELSVVGPSIVNHFAIFEPRPGINAQFGTPNLDDAKNYAIARLEKKGKELGLVRITDYSDNGDIKVQRLDHAASLTIRPLRVSGIQIAPEM